MPIPLTRKAIQSLGINIEQVLVTQSVLIRHHPQIKDVFDSTPRVDDNLPLDCNTIVSAMTAVTDHYSSLRASSQHLRLSTLEEKFPKGKDISVLIDECTEIKSRAEEIVALTTWLSKSANQFDRAAFKRKTRLKTLLIYGCFTVA